MTASVSTIIPCYNAAEWITPAIESALGQTCPEHEVIVVNDGSTDESLECAQAFARRGVIVVDQRNQGAAAARNAGLARAQGRFIQFLDADDLLAPEKIAAQLATLAAAPARSVASGAWGSFRRDPTAARFEVEPVWRDFAPVDWLVCSWTGGGMMHPAAWLTPRAVIDAAGPWNPALSLDDDGEFFSRVVLQSAGVRFVSSARSFYRAHDGNRLSASGGPPAWQSALRACELKATALLAAEDSPRTRQAAARNFARLAWEIFPEAGPLAATAIKRARELDPRVPFTGGGARELAFARWFGWRAARRLQKLRQSWQRRRRTR